MVALESTDGRQFTGRLDPGDNPFAGILGFCAENRIKTGWLQAVAVINGIEVRTISPGQGFAKEAKFFDGLWFCPLINGNLSSMAGRADLRLYVSCQSDDGRVVSGLLAGGIVEMFEFHLWSIDDMSLERDPMDKKYAAWTNLVPMHKTRPSQKNNTRESIRTTSIEKPQKGPEPDINLISEMNRGDFIQHPTLGKCRIMDKPNEEKIRIRLSNGRIANLDAKVLNISPYKVINGNRVYQVQVKRP